MEERCERWVTEHPGDDWREEEKKHRNTSDEDDLKESRLFLDSGNIFRIFLDNFADVFRHGGRDAVSDENDDHGGEGDDEAIATIVCWPEDAPSDRVYDIGSDIENHFGDCEPDERRGEFFHRVLIVVAPPRLSKEGAGGGILLFEIFFNFQYHSIQIIIDIIIPKTQYHITKALKVYGSVSIVWNIFFVLPSIDFNNQFLFRATEVDDILSNSMLPTKSVPKGLSSETGPKNNFLWGRIFS